MDRRQFMKGLAAAVVGIRVADKVLPEQLADAGGFYVPREFMAEFNRYERELLFGTGRDEPRGILNAVEKLELDLRLYGNAYMRRDGSRVLPLQAVREMRRRHG